MAKYREVPKSLVTFNSDDLSEDTELISPELLFEDFENESFYQVTLDSPQILFAKSSFSKIKLKSPEELFGEFTKQPTKDSSGNHSNSEPHKKLPVKKDKKAGK